MASPDAVALIERALKNASDFGKDEPGWHHPDCLKQSELEKQKPDYRRGECGCFCWSAMKGEADTALIALKAEPPPRPDLELARRVRDACLEAIAERRKWYAEDIFPPGGTSLDNRSGCMARHTCDQLAEEVGDLDLESIVRGGK